ncbi:MAG: hypothetical protein ABSG03_39795 [Bryobacteraceae bacterium]
MRTEAAGLDNNSELYVLLRLSTWMQREALKGRIAGAMWIRHMAEVIRRGFEELHAERWLEEDQAFGQWHSGGRKRVFGSERPLDDGLQSKPYIAYRFGLFTGSAVHWYVEGDTEYHAAFHILREPPKMGIELTNLRGNIASQKKNAARNLEDSLKEDKALRRFSMISFDCDVPENVRTIQCQIRDDNIVGAIAGHKPDFEFANFTVQELAEVAARIDEADNFDGNAVRKTDFSGINSGRKFERKYLEVSARKRPLKGKKWGKALAQYAIEHARRPDDGTERPLLQEIRAAMLGWNSNYDFHKENFQIDSTSFLLIPRASGPLPVATPSATIRQASRRTG